MDRSLSADSSRSARIALINMPFARTAAPSIQCGLLKSSLTNAGHSSRVYYLNLELAAEIGSDNYLGVSDSRYANALVGEWLFSSAVFGYEANEEEYLLSIPGLSKIRTKVDVDLLVKLRKKILPEFITRWAKRIDWTAYDAVGFTSTFAQNNAAFAFARCIKELNPEVATIFGGANFAGGMGKEYLRKLSFIDYIVDGEGESVIVGIADRIAQGESPLGVPGVSGRRDGDVVDGGVALKATNMDALAVPNYDEYFETMWRLGRKTVMGDAEPMLLLETARGCWWGEKHHCTFCGLNAMDMGFRSKTPEKALEELKELSKRYQTTNIEVVDNIINVKYIDRLCKPLIQENYDMTLFWEVKANLTASQLRTMATAGIFHLQPGIESLSTHVLELMRKGITMLKNVRFLKWACYFNMNPRWNMLTGFPGETEEDYIRQKRLIPLLKHLSPPGGWGTVWIERFSPFFTDPSFPVEDLRPGKAYEFIYPNSNIDLEKIAYFFDYTMRDTLPSEHHEEMYAQLQAWKDAWDQKSRPMLVYRKGPDWMEVIDQRGPKAIHHWLYGNEVVVYEACNETDRTADAVVRSLKDTRGAIAVKDVEMILQKCCDLGIMIEEDGHYLSLALPFNRNWFLERGGGDPASQSSAQASVAFKIIDPMISLKVGQL